MPLSANTFELVETDEIDDRHIDENNPYDGSGLAPRACTDTAWLVVFATFFLGMCGIAHYAFANGDPRRLTHGYDYHGNLCGVDKGLTHRPLVYWCGAGALRGDGIPTQLDLKFPVCVGSCPADGSTEMACLGVEQLEVRGQGRRPYRTVITEVTQSTVQQLSYPTVELAGLYCIPHLGRWQLPGKDHLTKSLLSLSGPVGNYYARLLAAAGGLMRCWTIVAASVGLAVLLGYAYLLVLHTCAGLLIHCALILVPLSSLVAGGFFLLWAALKGRELEEWELSNQLYHQYDVETARFVSTVVGALLLLLGLVLAFVSLALRPATEAACNCAQVASECVFGMPALLLQPLLQAIWNVCSGFIMLCALVWLLSTAQMEDDFIEAKGIEVGGLTRTLVFSEWGKAMLAYFLLGLIWLLEMSSAMSQFVVSFAVVLWYYTPKPKGTGPRLPLQRGLLVGLGFHLGTIALGSLLIAVLRPMRLVLGMVSAQARSGENRCCEVVAACLSCCIGCYRRQLEFIGRTAYVDVCISSTGFCAATQSAFNFVVSEGGKVLSLTGACFIFSAAGVLGIATASGGLAYVLLLSSEAWMSESSPTHVADPLFVAIVAAISGGAVASCFTVTFDHAADALLYAFVWNKSHGHNTVQKYAPDSLALLLEYRPLVKPPPVRRSGGECEAVRARSTKGGAVLNLLNAFFEKGYVQEETEALMYR